jgi:glucose/arabinose dehydrogenase
MMKMKVKVLAPPTIFLLLVASFPLFFASSAFGQTQSQYTVQVAFPQLTFNQPVGVYYAPDDSHRLFVVEQLGVIQVFHNSPTTANASIFLDIQDRVLFSGEQGLLGLAFHPNYTTNGYFYVDYVAPNPTRTVIARYHVASNNSNQVDLASELILLTIPQPFPNHKGGQIAFGPDGYLYIGMGDGGSEGDPLGNGQNRSTLLGKILRIDVNNPSVDKSYTFPPDNPFVGNIVGYREEIYAWGFRNPWRFSFDSVTGRLWVGEVGQNTEEEIDLVEKGKNYGWNIMEGTLIYAGGNTAGLTLPVYAYNHTLGNAIIGGYVYHGAAVPSLQGAYVYGDYGSGRIWTLSVNDSGVAVSNSLLVLSNLTISSFGVDQTGEMYVCSFNGKIYQIIALSIPEFSNWAFLTVFLGATALILVGVKKGLSALRLPEPHSP